MHCSLVLVARTMSALAEVLPQAFRLFPGRSTRSSHYSSERTNFRLWPAPAFPKPLREKLLGCHFQQPANAEIKPLDSSTRNLLILLA
ncbi:MAG: hypothetical protein RLZZ375_332 [Pseudomonadota bacterium]|jgi:hypothetical protein